MLDSISPSSPDWAVGPLSGMMLAILMGPAGMFEHWLPPPVLPPVPAALVLEPELLHAARPTASSAPAATGKKR